MALSVFDTPIRKNTFNHQANLYSEYDHAISECAIDAGEMDRYITAVKETVPSEAWKDIAEDADILAVREAILNIPSTALEKKRYGLTTKLLNLVSRSVFSVLRDSRRIEDQDVACIFSARPDHIPRGDIHDTQIRPDYPSFFGIYAELEIACNLDHYVPNPMLPWPELGNVGEQKRTPGTTGTGQFKTYLTTLKRYRPDLPTIHGVLVSRDYIQLSQLNACGMWSSKPAKISGSLDPWIAFVVLVYRSYDQRDKKLCYNATQNSFLRWDVMDATGPTPMQKYALTPFYTVRCPGRGTFAAFQVVKGLATTLEARAAFHGGPVEGFWKTSWQQRRQSKERELLDRLHGPGRWIPGLVRPYAATSDELLVVPSPSDVICRTQPAANIVDDSPATSLADQASSVSTSNGLGDTSCVERVQEVVHIGSIGEPLSQCETPRELLFSAYDLIETYVNVLEHGVIHRDFSWFNVMCKPIHYEGGDPAEQERPCIKKILHEVGHYSDGKPLVSSVLLGDLDHAIDLTELQQNSHRRERTGTPMFISVQLGDPREMSYRLAHDHWDDIFSALHWVDDHELGPDVLRSAFPEGDDDLMGKLHEVLQLEKSRKTIVKLRERPVHRPWHDAESMFWVYLWAFARARPRGSPHEIDTDEINKASKFCEHLLAHEVGKPGSGFEDYRAKFLKVPSDIETLFHPSFAPFESLFVAMASYLKVPWHLYEKTIGIKHAHFAYRRMMVGFILKTDAALLDVLLDTEQPRIVWTPNFKKHERISSFQSDLRATVGASGRSHILEELRSRGSEPGERSSKKRKTPCDDGDGGAHKKSTGPGRQPQLRPIPAEVATKDDDVYNETFLQCARHYCHDLHLHLRSAYALRLKVWKDRTLWFSKGT